MAGARFGDVGGCFLVLRALFIDVSNVSRINHESQIFVAGTIFGDVGG